MTVEKPDDMEALMRRIQKLLAIAADNRADQNEASAAAGMAERLMRKFQIEHSDLVIAQLQRDDGFGANDVVATAKTNGTPVREVPVWVQWLAVRLGKLHEVKVVLAHTGEKNEACVRFMGFKSDVMVASWTLSYLVDTVNRLCTQYRTSEIYKVFGRKEMNAYRHGVTTGILHNIEELLRSKQAEFEAAKKSEFSLVVIKAKAVAERYGETRTKKGNTSVRGMSHSVGVQDGKAVDVGRRAIGTQAGATVLGITQ